MLDLAIAIMLALAFWIGRLSVKLKARELYQRIKELNVEETL